MKRRKPMPIPQWEFGFTADSFNLIQETGFDGERIAREKEEMEKARKKSDVAQTALFTCRH